MEEFERWLEPRLGTYGPLSILGGWGNKLAGGCARIAGILHLCGGDIEQVAPEIPLSTVEAGIRPGREYFLPHARTIFHLMREDARLPLAPRILGWAKKNGLPRFSRRDCHLRFNDSIVGVEALDGPLLLLETHGWVRQLPSPERSGPGRKPSPVFEVHPEIKTLDYGANPDLGDDLLFDE
jgi:replicative DNA helicase